MQQTLNPRVIYNKFTCLWRNLKIKWNFTPIIKYTIMFTLTHTFSRNVLPRHISSTFITVLKFCTSPKWLLYKKNPHTFGFNNSYICVNPNLLCPGPKSGKTICTGHRPSLDPHPPTMSAPILETGAAVEPVSGFPWTRVTLNGLFPRWWNSPCREL